MAKINRELLDIRGRDIYDAAYAQAREEADQIADAEDDEYLPPAPDEVALALIQGLAASGKFDADTLPSLIGNAWAAVPHFYIERENYAQNYAPMFFKSAQTTNDDLEDVNGRLT